MEKIKLSISSFLKFKTFYIIISGAILTFGLIGIILGFTVYYNEGLTYQHKNYENFFDTIPVKKYINKPLQPIPDSKIDSNSAKVIERVFNETYIHYKENNNNINSSLNYMLILILIGVIVILFNIEKIDIPFFSLTIPRKLVHFVVGLGVTYFWIHTGLLTNDSVDSRLTLLRIIKFTEEKCTAGTLSYNFSLRTILADGAFIDNITSVYYDLYEGRNFGKSYEFWLKILEYIGLFVVYGNMLGLGMGTSLRNYYEFVKHVNGATVKTLSIILFIFSLSIYLLASLAVISKFHHLSNFFGYIWFISGLVMLVRIPEQKNLQLAEKEKLVEMDLTTSSGN